LRSTPSTRRTAPRESALTTTTPPGPVCPTRTNLRWPSTFSTAAPGNKPTTCTRGAAVAVVAISDSVAVSSRARKRIGENSWRTGRNGILPWAERWLRRPAAQSEAQPKDRKEHTSELQSRENLVCRLLLEKKKKK